MTRERSAGTARVLVQRNFGLYFLGNLTSNCGTWFQAIAQSLLVYRLTHSAFLLGVVNFSQFVGVFVLAPWAGPAADRYDRKRLLVVTQVFAAGGAGLLAVLSRERLASAPVVIVFALALGLTTAFAIPALQAVVPSLVSRADLGSAVALSAVSFNLARVLGPAAGAFVVARFGITTAFAANSASYLVLVLALLFVHPAPQPPRPAHRPRLLEAVTVVARDRRLAILFAVITIGALAQDPVNTLMPAFAVQVFHRPDTLAGYLIGAFGVGSVTSAFLVVRRLGTSSTALASAMAVLGLGMAGFAATTSLAIGVIALFVGGIGFLAAVTGATTDLQLTVAEEQRGRVMALWSVAFLGTRPFGSLADGAVASAAGVRMSAVVMAGLAFAGAIGVAVIGRRRV